MKTKIEIAGNVSSALTYFAALGTALVIQEELDATAKIGYSEESVPKANVYCNVSSPEQVAEAIKQVAMRWSCEDSWVASTMLYPDKNKTAARSPFSPRIQAFTDDSTWERHKDFRNRSLDHAFESGDLLALSFIAGLGEAAYWRFERKDIRPDQGASRWEMKTRNRGQEFVKDRLALLVDEISTWEVSAILNGLLGDSVNDCLGKNKEDSRSSTGFTIPGPADNALAFVALIGIGAFPVVPHVHEQSSTPAAYPAGYTHPRFGVFPVPSGPISLASFSSVLVSSRLDLAARDLLGLLHTPEEQIRAAGTASWLRQRGIGALVSFDILKAGSASAPERQILDGKLVPL